jgi:hypothetical protein
VIIVRNELCDIQKKLENFRTADAFHTSSITSQNTSIALLQTTTNSLQEEINFIDTKLSSERIFIIIRRI